MINQSAIFVDAGFLLSAGGHRVADTSLRNAVKVQYSTLVKGLNAQVRAHNSAPILRTYWYDASRDGLLTDDQKRVSLIPDVKVRLGRLNYFGEQKGVDLRLALDLVGLARTGSISVAYLASGDDDLTEAVEEAQSLGVKVVLLAIKDDAARLGYSSVADHLAVTVDSIIPLPDELLTTAFTRTYEPSEENARTASAIASAGGDGTLTDTNSTPPSDIANEPQPEDSASATAGTSHDTDSTHPSESSQSTKKAPSPSALAARTSAPTLTPTPTIERPAVVYSSRTGDGASGVSGYQGLSAHEQEVVETAERIGAQVARTWYASANQSELNEMLADRPLLPPDIDRVLLKDCAQAIGEQDTYLQSVRRTLRWAFWAEVEKLQ